MKMFNTIIQFNATPLTKEFLIYVLCQQNTVCFKKVYYSTSENTTTLDSHDTPKTLQPLEHELKGVKQHIKQSYVIMINPQKAHLAYQALILGVTSGKEY